MVFLHRLLLLLTIISTLSTTYLYSYPFFHGCAFPFRDVPSIPSSPFLKLSTLSLAKFASADEVKAPFRLLVLSDPQLEGDTSIPKVEEGYFATIRDLKHSLESAAIFASLRSILGDGLEQFFTVDLPAKVQAWRKHIDLIGNDYYLAHIYRTLHRQTQPTHVAVLGDLLGSQWIDDEEFDKRGWRFWQRVFRHGQRVKDDIMEDATSEVLGADNAWKRRIINIAGNHDVGYAGDMTVERLQRFERQFGKANWEITFRLPSQEMLNGTQAVSMPELRLIILNSMNLDTPALSQELQTQTYDFINSVITRSKPVEDLTIGTILLTHIPLHKEPGICADSPFFTFHDNGEGVKEQNHLSFHGSKGILEGIYGMSGNLDAPARGRGRNGIILTGHDHEGCDVHHYLPPAPDEEGRARDWNATRWIDAEVIAGREDIPGIREITVRSMMGDFGGNAGLLSAWYDGRVGEWRFAYSSCSIGVQHIWWAVHVLLVVTIGLGICVGLMAGFQGQPAASGVKRKRIQEVVKTVDEKANGILHPSEVLGSNETRFNKKAVKRRK